MATMREGERGWGACPRGAETILGPLPEARLKLHVSVLSLLARRGQTVVPARLGFALAATSASSAPTLST
jgi:hypothetical protein